MRKACSYGLPSTGIHPSQIAIRDSLDTISPSRSPSRSTPPEAPSATPESILRHSGRVALIGWPDAGHFTVK